jgi:hypothetical protein
LSQTGAGHQPRINVRSRLKPAVAALGLLTVLFVSACGSAKPQVADSPFDRSLFGPFAGYLWTGNVHQVSSVVIVPRVGKTSQPGLGATWIGATGRNQSKVLVPSFFQIGINEVRGRDSLGARLRDYEYVFWSSTAKRFHPQFLFDVAAGDRVRLSMTLVGGRWRMGATDESTGRSRSVSISVGGGNALYTEASWLQEDVAISDAGTQSPYPELDGLRVSNLMVNSVVPTAHSLTKSWMSTARGTFGPTTIRGQAFSVAKVHPTRADLKYEQTAYALNLPAAAFAINLERWNEHTKRAQIASDCRSFAAVLQRNTTAFARYKWPAGVRPLMRHLVSATEASRTIVLDLSRLPPSAIHQGVQRYVRSLEGVQTASLRIKARLHIPVNNYSDGVVVAYAEAHAH